MVYKKVKDMTTEELLKRERKLRTQEKERYEESMVMMRGWVDEERQEIKKLKEPKKGYIIEIGAQSFTIDSMDSAREKVKSLMDVGLWWIELKQIK